jgi:hypothetical protein
LNLEKDLLLKNQTSLLDSSIIQDKEIHVVDHQHQLQDLNHNQVEVEDAQTMHLTVIPLVLNKLLGVNVDKVS